MIDKWTKEDYVDYEATYKFEKSDYAWHICTLDDCAVMGIRAWGMAGTKCTRCGLHFEVEDMIYEMPPRHYGYYCKDCMLQFTW